MASGILGALIQDELQRGRSRDDLQAKEQLEKDKKLQQYIQLAQQLSYLKENLDEVPAGKGFLAKPRGAYEEVKQFLGVNPALDEYESKKGLLTGGLSKEVGGQTGTLSDPDIERALKGLPGSFDSAESRQRKLGGLRRLLEIKAQQDLGQYMPGF